MKIDRRTQDKIWHLLLRWIPILPAPEIYDLLRDVKRSQTDVDRQVSEAIESIEKTSALVAELEGGLKERAAKLEHLQREHARYSQLATIEAEKAGALLTQIEETLGKNVQKERWIAFGINIAAGLVIFLLGVIFSDRIKHIWTTLMK
jgi:predicted RNase H-like nuclease (RuvC/YqgF family)